MTTGLVLIAAIVPLIISGMGLMAWMVKTLLTTATTLTSTAEKLDDIERRNNDRFQRIEGVVFTPSWKQHG